MKNFCAIDFLNNKLIGFAQKFIAFVDPPIDFLTFLYM